jgi:hypothetical protein
LTVCIAVAHVAGLRVRGWGLGVGMAQKGGWGSVRVSCCPPPPRLTECAWLCCVSTQPLDAVGAPSPIHGAVDLDVALEHGVGHRSIFCMQRRQVAAQLAACATEADRVLQAAGSTPLGPGCFEGVGAALDLRQSAGLGWGGVGLCMRGRWCSVLIREKGGG